MEEKKKKKVKVSLSDLIALLLLLFVIVYELFHLHVTDDLVLRPLLDMTLTRFAAGTFFLILAIQRGMTLFSFAGKRLAFAVLSLFPCLLLVLNNLPILSLLRGDAYLIHTGKYLAVFALQCVAVAYFEEIAFRGLFFLLALRRYHASRIQIFFTVLLSSAVFGLYHLFNLLEGSAPGAVFLQIGYSTLIGAMCAAAFLKSGNLGVCIVLHAVYNFCGMLVPTLGGGSWWDTPTVIFTALLAVGVLLYMLWLFFKTRLFEVSFFFRKENLRKENLLAEKT